MSTAETMSYTYDMHFVSTVPSFVLSYSNCMNFLPVLIILILVSNHVLANKGLLKYYIGISTWTQSACFDSCIASLFPIFVFTSIIIFIPLNWLNVFMVYLFKLVKRVYGLPTQIS